MDVIFFCLFVAYDLELPFRFFSKSRLSQSKTADKKEVSNKDYLSLNLFPKTAKTSNVVLRVEKVIWRLISSALRHLIIVRKRQESQRVK